MSDYFRLIAFDETTFWDGLPDECTQVFGVYLFKEGEATYCAAISPSSWCEFIENVFIGLDNDHDFVEADRFTGESGYRQFIDVDNPKWRLSTHRIVVDDLDEDESAWNVALESAQSNPPYIPLP